MAFERVRRWTRDRFSSDAQITEHPKKTLVRLEEAITDIPAGQRQQAVEYIKHYSNLYYAGRHNDAIPPDFVKRVNELEQRARRADVVDHARAFIEKYGPPEKALATFAAETVRAQKRHFETARAVPAGRSRKQQLNENAQAAGISM
jgi:hypothetical protein